MITNRIGRHEVLLPINHKILIYKALFKIKTQEIPRFPFFVSSAGKKSHLSARVIARSVLFYCPIETEIANQI